MPDTLSDSWLTLDEAAGRLGVGRLRVREAIAAGVLPARRDNRGFWQVLLGADLAGTNDRLEAARLPPDALVDLLFDEIDETNLLLADRDESLERLTALAARQQEMLARALSLAEAPGAVAGSRIAELNDRSGRLIEGALHQIAIRDGDIARLTGLLDRALNTIAGLEEEVTRQAGVAERQKGMMEKLFALADSSLERFARSEARGKGLLDRLRDRFGGRGAGNGT